MQDIYLVKNVISDADRLEIGIPRDTWGATIAPVVDLALKQKMEQVLTMVPSLVKRTVDNFLLLGVQCTGKTTFASILLQEARKYAGIVLYVRAEDLVATAPWEKETLPNDPHYTLYEKIRLANLMVIDNLGMESKTNPTSHKRLENVLRCRYEENKGTVLLSNHRWGDMKKMYAPSMYSVILRMIKYTMTFAGSPWVTLPVEFGGVS